MMIKDLLRAVIYDQQPLRWDDRFIERQIPSGLIESGEITVISGIRRCGKSTLLHQIRSKQDERDYYMNFDDERLVNFKTDDFQLLYETFIELFGQQKTFYFDEIQNITGWERFVRRLHDLRHKVFITGSNATMLSRELGTHLTGRYQKIELYPFSFTEFLQFKGRKINKKDISGTTGKSELKRLFNEYLTSGGFPEFLKNHSESYLKSLYESILYRDVMVRNHLTNEKELQELVYFLASNVSKMTSNNALAKVVGLKNATTIKNYLAFLQNTYLLFPVSRFDFSLKKQIQNPRKIYFIDNALVTRLGFYFSEEKGRMLENLIFVELKRNDEDIYYHHGQYECDFVTRIGHDISNAIQVCHAFDSAATREREIRGLKEAVQRYGLKEGMIITQDLDENIVIDGVGVHIIPAWKWMLRSSLRLPGR